MFFFLSVNELRLNLKYPKTIMFLDIKNCKLNECD